MPLVVSGIAVSIRVANARLKIRWGWMDRVRTFPPIPCNGRSNGRTDKAMSLMSQTWLSKTIEFLGRCKEVCMFPCADSGTNASIICHLGGERPYDPLHHGSDRKVHGQPELYFQEQSAAAGTGNERHTDRGSRSRERCGFPE